MGRAARTGLLRAPALRWLLVLLAAPGCGSAGERMRVWACGDGIKVAPDGRWFEREIPPEHRERNSVWDGETVRIAAARGETVAFQLQIEAGDRDLAGVDAQIVPGWDAGDPPARFSLFRVFYTRVTEPSTSPGPSLGPGWYPDALIPFEVPDHGAPFAIARGRTQGVWVDAQVPATAPAGLHRAEIRIRVEGARARRIPLELEVFDFALPERSSFRINVATYDLGKGGHAINSGWGHRFDIWGEPFRELEQRFYRMARAHRHVLHARNYELPVRSDERGALEIDWRRFDDRWGALFDGSAFPDGAPLDYWEISLRRNVPPERYGGTGSPAWRRAAAAYARAFADHFRARGWSGTRLVAFPVDEPSREEAFAEAQLLAEAVSEGAPEIAFRIDVYKALSRELIERFDPLVDIWAVQGSYFRGLLDELVKRRARGAEVWFYQGSAPALGPEILDAEALALRTWGWIGWRYDLDGADLWECCKWQLTENIWTEPQNNPWPTNGPGVLYYPGAHVGVDAPIPSLRLKALRRGAFDYEYLALLDARGGRARAEAIAASVVGSALDHTRRRRGQEGDWRHDPDRWEEARLALAREITALLAGPRAR